MSEPGVVKILNHNESEGTCELCGKEDDLRPYGPNGAWVCYSCGMKDEEEAKRQFAKLIEGVDTLIVDAR